MTVIINIFFILYTLFALLAVITLLYATPVLIEKVSWLSWLKLKTDDEKVLTVLPVHIIFIILVATSVWKFQLWKTHYETQSLHEQILEGDAPIAEPYYDFLVQEYPDLGKEYQRILSEKLMISDHLHNMSVFRKSLRNQNRFINNVIGRWGMMADQLNVLKATIETKSMTAKKSMDIAAQTQLEIKQEISQTYAQILKARNRLNALMAEYALKSTRFLSQPVLSDPGYPVFSLKKDNYDRVISFFLSEHSELITPLDLITQKIRASNKVIADLNKQIKKRQFKRKDIAKSVLSEWKKERKYAHLRLLKILYAIETEYVLKEMGMTNQHPAMKKLREKITEMTKYYSQKVHALWLATTRNSNPDLLLGLH